MGLETGLAIASAVGPTLYQVLNPADSPTGISQTQPPQQGQAQTPPPLTMQPGYGQPDPMMILLGIMSQLGQFPGSNNTTGGF